MDMKKRVLACALSAASLALAAACVQPAAPPANQSSAGPAAPTAAAIPAELKPALDTINAEDILRHTKTLSADEFGGRGPGT